MLDVLNFPCTDYNIYIKQWVNENHVLSGLHEVLEDKLFNLSQMDTYMHMV